ncbi:hypothetical protein CR513_44452, partial [Mucuna pruriens]
MNNARACKVYNPGSKQQIFGSSGTTPPVRTPEPMRHYGVHQTVSNELRSLRDGTARDPRDSDGEGPLVEKVTVVESWRRKLVEAEEVLPDETVGRGAESQGKSEQVEEDAAGGRVEDVGQHYVHGVLGSYGTGAEHGKAELHS